MVSLGWWLYLGLVGAVEDCTIEDEGSELVQFWRFMLVLW